MKSRGLDLFEWANRPRESTSADANSQAIGTALRSVLSDVLRKSRFSREQVADRMGEFLGAVITKAMLDTWTAESKGGHRFPAEYLPAFVRATGNQEPLQFLAEVSGYHLVTDAQFARSEITRLAEEERRLRTRRQTLEKIIQVRGE